MRLIVYDTEVFCEDCLVVLKDMETGKYTAVHNDNEELKQCISEDNIYVGFNSEHYDQFIIKAICCRFTPQEVKQANDYLIGGGQGWEYPPLRDFFFKFNNVDIKDDMLKRSKCGWWTLTNQCVMCITSAPYDLLYGRDGK